MQCRCTLKFVLYIDNKVFQSSSASAHCSSFRRSYWSFTSSCSSSRSGVQSRPSAAQEDCKASNRAVQRLLQKRTSSIFIKKFCHEFWLHCTRTRTPHFIRTLYLHLIGMSTWRSLGEHLESIWRPVGEHLESSWRPLATTWRPLGAQKPPRAAK